MNYLLVGLGGAIGACLRFAVLNLCVALRLTSFPYATFIVNILGSFCIGLLSFYLIYRFSDSQALRLFLLIGILGAFTTFSTFSLDSIALFTTQRYVMGTLYIVGSVVLCILAAVLGIMLANKLR